MGADSFDCSSFRRKEINVQWALRHFSHLCIRKRLILMYLCCPAWSPDWREISPCNSMAFCCRSGSSSHPQRPPLALTSGSGRQALSVQPLFSFLWRGCTWTQEAVMLAWAERKGLHETLPWASKTGKREKKWHLTCCVLLHEGCYSDGYGGILSPHPYMSVGQG